MLGEYGSDLQFPRAHAPVGQDAAWLHICDCSNSGALVPIWVCVRRFQRTRLPEYSTECSAFGRGELKAVLDAVAENVDFRLPVSKLNRRGFHRSSCGTTAKELSFPKSFLSRLVKGIKRWKLQPMGIGQS